MISPIPFISILTAALNSADVIGRNFDSLKMQYFRGFEQIVIDGGSEDKTVEILEKYTKQYKICWKSEPDRGISHALNKALRMASGRYILVLHGDDRLLAPGTLENVHGLIKDEFWDIYSFPVLKQTGRNRYLYKPIRLKWWHHFKTIFPHQGAFVHRRIFDRIGGFTESFSIAMDYDFFYRALNVGASVKFGKTPVAEMGGYGISSSDQLIVNRLQEEQRVQRMNESNFFWRAAQELFKSLYVPYKTRLTRNGENTGNKKDINGK